jgi:hypothetical protein
VSVAGANVRGSRSGRPVDRVSEKLPSNWQPPRARHPFFSSFYGEFSSSDARFRFLQATVPAWLMTTPAILVYYTGKKMCSMEDVQAFLTGDRMVNPEPDLGCFPLQKKCVGLLSSRRFPHPRRLTNPRARGHVACTNEPCASKQGSGLTATGKRVSLCLSGSATDFARQPD